MRVLMVASSFPRSPQDWRSRFIERMASALASRNDLALDLWAPPGHLPEGVGCHLRPEDARFLDRLQQSGGIAHLLRNRPLAGLRAGFELLYRLRKAYLGSSCDIYHVNWLQNALALPDDRKPALVTALGSDFGLLRLPAVTGLLRRQFCRRRVIVAPNADWMCDELVARFGHSATIRSIPFGVDDVWLDINRLTDTQPRRWLVVVRVTKAKIGSLFEHGRDIFKSGNDELHLFGPNQDDTPIPDWVHYHGPTNLTELALDWYPRATGMITLSRHDEGRPQVLIEAMASGLPVIASAIPAHRDLITHGEHGYLVDDEREFRNAVQRLADADRNRMMGAAARKHVIDTIGTWSVTAGRYYDAYAEIL